MTSKRILLTAFTLLSLATSAGFAAAQGARPTPADATRPAPVKPPVAEAAKPAAEAARPATTGAAPATATQAVDILGFRSAHFGMDEAGVRAAIEADFGKEIAGRIQAQENLAEKTKSFNVLVPNLFDGAGVASVSYVFGYKSKKLIQVVVLWSPQTDPTITPETLFSSANVLQGYFVGQGYMPGTVVSGAVIDAGILMFRGSDKDENTAMLLLQGGFTGEGQQRNLTPNALVLYYIDDAKNPDVFRIPTGKF